MPGPHRIGDRRRPGPTVDCINDLDRPLDAWGGAPDREHRSQRQAHVHSSRKLLCAALALTCAMALAPPEARADNPPMNVNRMHPGASPADLRMVRSSRAICPRSNFTIFGSMRAEYQHEPFAFDLFEQNGIDRRRLTVIGPRVALKPSFGLAFGEVGLEIALRAGLLRVR